MNFQNELLNFSPFSCGEKKKEMLFSSCLKRAFQYHRDRCPEFAFFCRKQGYPPNEQPENLSDYPYIPASLFKTKKLISVPEQTIKARIMSSATSGTPSVIFVDKAMAGLQAKVSAKITADYIGPHRRPFLVMDADPSKNRSKDIYARSAATQGFLIFAESAEFYLKEKDGRLSLDMHNLIPRLKEIEAGKKEVSIFGFTYILYHHMIRLLKEKKIRYNLPATVKVIHIGGWKKLEDQKVSRQQFLNDIFLTLGLDSSRVFDFYGFTEQMGLVYGNRADYPKTVPLYAEIIIRDPLTLEPVEDRKEGLIQMLTPLPSSYPGISVLTDDIGRIIGRGQDRDGRWGTQFEVTGRAEKSDLRGCGDILGEIMG